MIIKLASGREISVSTHNSKMGNVFSFSVPPVVTCAAGVPCKKECYACKLCRIYKTVREAYDKNFDAIQNAPMHEIIGALIHLIREKNVELFRFNVAGDFGWNGTFDGFYFNAAARVAALCPNTKFLAFTKFYEAFGRKRPSNFNLIASVWNDYAPENMDDKPTAHYCDGSRGMPPDAIECGGNCEECGRCFTMTAGDKVYFRKH